MLQINLAIAVTKEEGPDKDNLNSLKNDIEQLIKLTKESLDRIESSSSQQNDNQIEDEYTVFQVSKQYRRAQNAMICFSDGNGKSWCY